MFCEINFMKLLFKVILLFFCASCAAQVIDLPEKQHGNVRISYELPTKYNEQAVELSWVDSNHEGYPSIKVEWYPEDWYIKFQTPLSNTKDSRKPFRWTYKSNQTFNAVAIVTFASGIKIAYPFVISIHRPSPVTACAGDSCRDLERKQEE